MKRFIAYFDYLGFKDFIQRNPVEFQMQIMDNNYRDISTALAKGKRKALPGGGYTPDLDNSRLRCINFSDTIIFYTNDDSWESLIEILDVSHWFNSKCNLFFFPVRGCLHYGEFVDLNFNRNNPNNGSFHVNSVYGDGLIKAYQKAESQAWAGAIIDETIVEYIRGQGKNELEVFGKYAKLFPVPYKSYNWKTKLKHWFSKPQNEWVINLLDTDSKLDAEALKRYSRSIHMNFANYNKRVDSPKVQQAIKNTLEFVRSYA